MFTPLPGRTQLGLPAQAIVAVIESMNCPHIALPNAGAETTKAYLIGVVLPSGGYSMVCYLLPTESKRPAMYVSQPPEVPLEHYSALEADAITYVESMGFMLENLNFRAQSDEARNRMVQDLPFFREPGLARVKTGAGLIAGVGETSPVVQLSPLGRLLLSF